MNLRAESKEVSGGVAEKILEKVLQK